MLLVEDDDAVRRSLQLVLYGRGFDVRAFGCAALATVNVEDGPADYLIADYRLPDGDGMGVLRALRQRGWTGRSILITGHASDLSLAAAWAAGFDAVLAKPIRHLELFAILEE